MKFKNFVLIISAFYVIIFIEACSSSKEIKKENEKTISRTRNVINIEAEERNYIKKNNIKEIDKISFDLDENKKPVNEEKLSTIKYNPEGFITETIIYNSKGDTDNIFTYNYKNKIRTKTIRQKPDGSQDKYYNYEYNQYGNKIKSTRFNLNGDIDKYYTYDYDEDGNLIKENWYDKTGKKEYSIEYEYDGKRKTAAITYNEDDDKILTYKFRYDKKGNIIEEEKYDPQGNEVGIIQYIYKYY